MKLLAKGSNKDIYELEDHPHHLLFKLTSRVSVFDVGALNDEIPLRAESMERFATSIARFLDSRNIPQAWDAKLSNLYSGFVQKRVSHSRIPSSYSKDVASYGFSTSAMPLMGAATELVSSLHDEQPVFIPLEVIVRWGVPVGSSLVKKDPEKFKVGTRFNEILLDFTTKLEAQDRPLTHNEAQELCPEGLKLQEIEKFIKPIAKILYEYFSEKGLELWDAKFELAWNAQTKSLLLVDAITPDEVRLTLKGLDKVPLSKELLRFWLRQTAWYDEVEMAKKKGGDSWRENLKPSPKLGKWRTQFLSEIYKSLADLVEQKSSVSLMNLVRGTHGVAESQLLKPKVCVIGHGGREEAIRWRLKNEGCDLVEKSEEADATFVSTDNDLAEGLADKLRVVGHWTFGPSQMASRLEWSKSFGREIANKANVPTPKYSRKLEDFKSHSQLPVVKLDGLAAGKGVFLPESKSALDELLLDLKNSHADYIFEERCSGEEASVFFNIERDAWGRESARFLGSAKDFKRRYLGDEGPNTGGMGAYVPHASITNQDIEKFRSWALSTAKIMNEESSPYRGIIYLGLMKDPQKGWILIEYNARLGDPETQALVSLWPESLHVMRSLLQLSPWAEIAEFSQESENHSLCLTLVHPEYPKVCEPLDLPEWNLKPNSQVLLFKTQSRTGRLAYLVAKASNTIVAGDKVFEELLESPWKNFIEWRSDILR